MALGIFGSANVTEAAVWYLDGRAVGTSANNGTQWASAWTNFNSIAWSSVAAGDTIYIAGGTYTGLLSIGKTGLPGKPIVLKKSQEPGYSGNIYFVDARVSGSMNYVILDGAKSDTFAAGITNTYQVAGQMTNNIGWFIDSGTLVNSAINMHSEGPVGTTVRWISCKTAPTAANAYGIRINGSHISQTVIEYCWLHDVGQDGLRMENNSNPALHDLTVRYCLVENVGDDFVEIGPGVTVNNCFMRNALDINGHPDGLSGPAGKQFWYNNIITDISERALYPLMWVGDVSDHYIYGNLIYDTRSYTNSVKSEVIAFLGVESSPNYVWPVTSRWSNVVIANNTFVQSGSFQNPLQVGNRFAPVWSGSQTTIVQYANWKVMNNIIYSKADLFKPTMGVDLKGYSAAGADQGIRYSTNDLVFNYNVVSGNTINARKIKYAPVEVQRSEPFDTAESLASVLPFKANSSTYPAFASPLLDDYSLQAADTAAKDRGADLGSLGLPGLQTDLRGVPRGLGAGWDVGALELVPPAGLEVWLNFDDDFADGKLDDASGHAAHAWRFGRLNNPTNWPVRVSVAMSPGRPYQFGMAGLFRWYDDDWGIYKKSGDYAGVTNITGIQNLPRATIMVWARYNAATLINPTYDHSQDQNATILSTGTASGKLGTWKLGRWYSGNTSFCILKNSSWDLDQVVFNDPSYATKGDTLQWNHYAVTFDSGRVTGYFNGAAFTNLTTTITNLTMGSFPHAKPWLGVGVDTHAGTPPMEDETGEDYPNHGWFNGMMDDVRVYSRVLTADEVRTIYAGATYAGNRPSQVRNIKAMPKQ